MLPPSLDLPRCLQELLCKAAEHITGLCPRTLADEQSGVVLQTMLW